MADFQQIPSNAVAHCSRGAVGDYNLVRRKCWRVLQAIAVGLLSAGCAVSPPLSRIDEAGTPPGAWTATRQAKAGIDDRWVDRFGGTELKQLVAEAYRSNHDLRAAAARVDRVGAMASAAGAAARPQLNASLSGARDARNFVGFPIGNGDDALKVITNNYGAQLGLSWEIDLWGRVRAGEQAALADLQAQGNLYRSARASLAAQVVRSWLLITELNGQVRLAEEALLSRRSMAGLVRGRFERATGGVQASASQLLLTETDVETSRAALAARQGERDQALRQLEILLGRYPQAGGMGATSLPAVKAMPPAGLPSELLLRRPDILVAERNLAAAGRRRDEAFLAFFPSFSLTASSGQSSDQLSRIFDSSFGVWSIAGQAAQPILRGGALKAQLAVRGAEEREALAKLQQVVLKGFGEIESTLAADRFLAQRVAAIDAAWKLAVDSAASARGEFERGTGDVLTLLAAENRRIGLVSQRLTLLRLRLDNRVNLHLALGGDYQL